LLVPFVTVSAQTIHASCNTSGSFTARLCFTCNLQLPFNTTTFTGVFSAVVNTSAPGILNTYLVQLSDFQHGHLNDSYHVCGLPTTGTNPLVVVECSVNLAINDPSDVLALVLCNSGGTSTYTAVASLQGGSTGPSPFPTWAIVLLAVAGVVVAAIVIGLLAYCCCCRRPDYTQM